jgi:hypothetical protein
MTNDYELIKAKAKLLRDKAEEIRRSPSYVRVIGVLSGLGFLVAPGIRKLANSKVTIEEAMSIGLAVEPRVLEVLPAAMLSFPRSFMHLEKAPQELIEVTQALRLGKRGNDFFGVPFQKIVEAANHPIKNRKRKVLDERRISRTFRFSQQSLNALTLRAKESGLSQTAYLEKLVALDSASHGSS